MPSSSTRSRSGSSTRPITRSSNGHGKTDAQRPEALPDQPAGPMTSATESPGEGGATAPEAATAVVERPVADDDEKARRRAESQERAELMAQLSAEVKMRVATREITLPQALAEAGPRDPRMAAHRRQRPARCARAPGDVERSATGADPQSESKPELDAQKAEAAAEGRELVGGAPGPDTQPVAPRTVEDAKPASVSLRPIRRRRSGRRRSASWRSCRSCRRS